MAVGKAPKKPDARSFVATKKLIPAIFLSAGTSNTFLEEVYVEDAFTAVRLGFLNPDAAAYTLGPVKVAAASAQGNNGTGLTWVSVTFDSSATAKLGDSPVLKTGSVLTASVPGATGASATLVHGVLYSDWITLPSIPQSNGARRTILQVRSYVAAAHSHVNTPSATVGVSYNSVTARPIKGLTLPGDLVTTTTTAMVPAGLEWPAVNIFQFAHKKPCKNIAVFGDSIDQGHGSAGADGRAYRNYTDVACEILTNTTNTIWNSVSYALGGQTTEQTYLWAEQIIPNSGFDYAIFSPYSPNNGDPTSAEVTAKYVIAFVALCKKNNVIPIIRAAIPRSTFDSVEEGYRVAFNLMASKLGSGVLVFDAASIVGDTAYPQRIKTTHNLDGTHINLTAYDDLGRNLALMLQD